MKTIIKIILMILVFSHTKAQGQEDLVLQNKIFNKKEKIFRQGEWLTFVTKDKKLHYCSIFEQTDSTLKLDSDLGIITILKSDLLAIKEFRFHNTEVIEETCGWIMAMGILGFAGLPFVIIDGTLVGWLFMEGILFGGSGSTILICNAQKKYNLKNKWRIVYIDQNDSPETMKTKN